jgi:RAQPRD family integrative conjugative element protein
LIAARAAQEFEHRLHPHPRRSTMFNFRSPAHIRRDAFVALSAALLFAVTGIAPARAAEAIAAPDNTAGATSTAMEREMLAAVARQLDLLDRLAERAAATSPQERARYHFDYPRLRADLQRVRAGVQDYLVPQRAQPRDPVPLTADYTRTNSGANGANGGKEATSP